MKKQTSHVLKAFLFALLISTYSKAQLTGVTSVPGTYTSIAAAINAVNLYGISGAVTINIAAGFTEIAPVGGYTLNQVVGSSTLNTLTFMKSGVGVNPIITANTGTSTSASAVQDGVWRFIGCDNVIIDGVDIFDPNSTNPGCMEFGYGFFKYSTSDGCQNNTIKNCTITLSRNNNAAGSGTAVDGSRGIDVVNALTSTHLTALIPVVQAGTNSNNKFYGNLIQNCNYGIALIGYAAPNPFILADRNNDIGGNSLLTGNTILNYGGGGTTAAAAAIRTLAQYNLNVSYNTINNNNGAGVSHAAILRGIYVNTAISANTTINNNTLTLNNGGTTTQVSVIENVSGTTSFNNTVTINNNLITGCTNSVNTTGAFYGIFNNAASASYLNINNNTFTNNTTAATSGLVYLVHNTGAIALAANLNGNNLSMGFNGATAYSGTNYNIYNTSGTTSSTISINTNTFSNYSYAVTGTGTTYFIYNTSGLRYFNMNSNTWNNLNMNYSGAIALMFNGSSTQSVLTVNNNSIVTGFNRSAASGAMYLYYCAASSLGTSHQFISGNNFSNITSPTSGAGIFYGMYNSDGSAAPYPRKQIFNNIVSNVNYNTTATSYGMYVSYLGDGSFGSPTSVYSNTVSNITFAGVTYGLQLVNIMSPSYAPLVYQNSISNVGTTGAAAIAYGVSLGTAATGIRFYRNKINDIYSVGATGSANGLQITSGTNAYFYNNVIGAITSPSTTSAAGSNGITITTGTSLFLYYNSVYLGGTSTGSGFGSNAINANTTPSITMNNNIFVNNCIPTGAGIAAAHRRSSATLTSYMPQSNNNLFYAGTPSATQVIFHNGTAYQTLANYTTAVAGRDAYVVTENPPFNSLVGSATNFLTINTAVATRVESGGLAVSGFTDDFNAAIRNANLPDLGAFEASNTIAGTDLVGPSINNIGFSNNACNLSSRTLTVTLADVSGVATGGAGPMVYYKVNAGTYSVVAGTLISGTAFSGNWSFILSYPGVVNDVISYYVVAQDVAGTPNLNSSSTLGFSGTNVTTIISPPTSPPTYTLAPTLNGVYTVGSLATYTSLTAASLAYNAGCLTGAVTFSLTSALYSSSEVFPITFTNNIYASSVNSLLIRPATGSTVNITGFSGSETALLKFINSRYITLDGIGGSSQLVLTQINNLSANAAVWLSSTSGVGPGNNFIGLRNLSISGSTLYTYGIDACVDGGAPSLTGGPDNDNISIVSNSLSALVHGIVGLGISSQSVGAIDGWLVQNNLIGPAVNGTANLTGYGCVLAFAATPTIQSNVVKNFSITAASIYGIALTNYVSGFAVSQNTISDMYTSAAVSGISSLAGILLGSNLVNGSATRNVIYRIENTNTSGYGARGIIVAGFNSSAIKVNNNMISDIVSYADASAAFAPTGIEVLNGSREIDIDYNSIYLFGSHPSLTTNCFAIGISVTSALQNINVRNNLIVNTYKSTNALNDYAYGIYSSAQNFVYTNFDYNNIYVAGTAGSLVTGYVFNADQPALPQFVSATGQNLNSKAFNAVFTATNDLHLVLGNATNFPLDNLGSPVAGITQDLDAQTRSNTTPDIGADEYTATGACAGAVGGTLTATSLTVCPNASLTLSSNGFSGGTGNTYQWMVSSVSGGTYVNVSSGSGITTPVLTTGTLSGTATLYYVLKSSCSSATAISNEATVTISSPPIIVASSSVLCNPLGTVTLTASGASSYTWNTGAISNSIVVSPTTSTMYNVLSNIGSCSVVASSNAGIAISNIAPIIVTTPVLTTVCAQSNATFTASGASTYTWSGGSTGANGFVFVASPGTAIYSVTATNSIGCVGSTTMGITANPVPTLNVSPSLTTVCENTPVTFSVNGANSYTWTGGSNSFSVSFTPTTITAYSVAGTNSFGCVSMVPFVALTYTLPVPIISQSSPTLCAKTSVTLSVTGANTYSWSTGSITTSAVVTPSANTIYSVIGTDGNNCKGTGTLSVVPFPLPSLTLTPTFSAVCIGGQNTVTASGAGPAGSYAWSSGQIGAIVAITPTATSFYTVTGTNSLSCSSSATINLIVNPLPVISLSPLNPTICLGETLSLTASGANSYTWNPGGVVATVFTLTPTNGVLVQVSGSDVNNCGDSKSVFAKVDLCTGISKQSDIALKVSAFPNPSQGLFTVEFEMDGNKEILVQNSMGQVILSYSTSNNTQVIDLTEFSKGVYYINVKSGVGATNFKMMIE